MKQKEFFVNNGTQHLEGLAAITLWNIYYLLRTGINGKKIYYRKYTFRYAMITIKNIGGNLSCVIGFL